MIRTLNVPELYVVSLRVMQMPIEVHNVHLVSMSSMISALEVTL